MVWAAYRAIHACTNAVWPQIYLNDYKDSGRVYLDFTEVTLHLDEVSVASFLQQRIIMRRQLGMRQALFAALSLLLAAGCGDSKKSTASKLTTISGTITDSLTDAVLPGAVVSVVGDGAVSVTSDASGNFSVVVNPGDSNTIILKATNPNYAPQYVRVSGNGSMNPNGTDLANKQTSFTLRPVDKIVTVTLPTGSAAAVSVGFDAGEGNTTLSIPADSLVHADGTPATGEANVALTYWFPYTRTTDIPAPLSALSPIDDGLVGLRSLGMTDIQITQAGAELQVAQDKNLELSWKIAQVDANDLVQADANSLAYPSLWYLDPNQALWLQNGSVKNAILELNVAERTFVAKLEHLSTWNIDWVDYPSNCVQGALVTDRNRPVDNTDMLFWWAGLNNIPAENQLMDYAFQTDASGKFCVNLAGAATRGWDTSTQSAYTAGGAPTEPYFISFTDPKDSACNPLSIDYTSSCDNPQPNMCFQGANRWAKTFNKTASGSQKCDLKTAALASCHVCPGTAVDPNNFCYIQPAQDRGTSTYVQPLVTGGCTDLGTIIVPTPSLCKGNNGTQGDACQANICCQKGLVCLDYLCVPPTDPNVTTK